jgi:hypothetical protein
MRRAKIALTSKRVCKVELLLMWVLDMEWRRLLMISTFCLKGLP